MQREKQCTKCGETKPLDGFHRDKGRVDGRRSHCKECMLEYARGYREENRDKDLDRKRRHYEENRDKMREYERRYYEENRDKIRERKRRYYKENRDILSQEHKSRHAQNARASTLLADRKGTPYSPEEDALLLANNGMTVYQKAITLGRTYHSCGRRLQRLRSREAADV